MGTCEQSEVIEANTNRNPELNDSSEAIPNSPIEQQRMEYPDMPEWDGDRYTGIGLKKMKGYKCDLPIDELNKKRDEFWDARNARETPNYKTWNVINQACVYDELRANMIMEEYGLTTKNGCINHIIDQEGNHYHVPNYCINDPFFERQIKTKKNVEEKKVKIKLFEPTDNIDEEKSVPNTMTGKELKEFFKKEHNIGDNFNLRMFFQGVEIKDEHTLYQHNLKTGYKIQVMKLPKIDQNTKSEKSSKKKGKDKDKEKDKNKDKKNDKKKKKKKHKEEEKPVEKSPKPSPSPSPQPSPSPSKKENNPFLNKAEISVNKAPNNPFQNVPVSSLQRFKDKEANNEIINKILVVILIILVISIIASFIYNFIKKRMNNGYTSDDGQEESAKVVYIR